MRLRKSRRFTEAPRRRTSGAALVEIIAATGCAMIVGGIALAVHLNAMTLFQKNGSINVNHETTRKVVDRLEKEIQSAISIPALVGTDRDIIDSSGPAPGIAFLRQSGPVRRIVATALAGANIVQLDSNGPAVKLGQRLIIPAYDIEGDVTAVNGNTVTIATPLPIDVKITSGALDRNIIAIVTDLISYVVIDGELREYQNAAKNDYNLVAMRITDPNPFGVPYNAVPQASPNP